MKDYQVSSNEGPDLPGIFQGFNLMSKLDGISLPK
jgi:hypothetical protein